MQPRSKVDGNSLSNKIYRAIIEGQEGEKHSHVLEEIRDLFVNYDSIVLSEEMILHKHCGTWESKFKNLSGLLSEFHVKFAICHRDVRHAVPSYYAETYGYLPKGLRKSFAQFVRGEWISQYRIADLVEQIESSLTSNHSAYFFEFEELTAAALTLNDIFKINEQEQCFFKPIVLGKANVKSSTDVGGSKKYTVHINYFVRLPMIVRKVMEKIDLMVNGYLNEKGLMLKSVKSQISVENDQYLYRLHEENQRFLNCWPVSDNIHLVNL